jgi:HPt (histidine-containing phosphotransfer) domain-containing protein
MGEALGRLGGNEELLRDIIGFFREDVPQLLEQMRAAIRDQNAEELARAAHSTKGLAANFSARATMEAALRVEYAAGIFDFKNATALVDRLAEEVALLCAALPSESPRTGRPSPPAG